MDNHKKLDSYNRFAKMKKEKIPASKTSPLAQTLILILKEKDYKSACKSYSSQRAFWVALSNLLFALRNHNGALEMAHIRKEVMLTANDQNVSQIQSLRGKAYDLVTLFNDGEYCNTVFREIWDLTERYYIRMKKELNLG
ncbi:hypothetical protein [Vibrio parahaemolyticus]|uniref:hypothetical protein n=1 Tax=Vibrio parahaemolyticus TaxID=670 RepID=UPI002269B95C|nr:hypothetical protein [Vibrio parahaemolyticus]EGR2854979.1 hypothetical protein [Vibrio parahaemolyticus]MCX8795890.1 hypothetical protein [Vibrio parahaemolyticus]